MGADAQSGAGSGVDVKSHTLSHTGDAQTITVPDAHLLFSGDYKRAGLDLVLSKDGHDHVIHDYFKGHTRATLASPDGAHLTGDLVNALTGEIQVAQASGATAAATVIGHVTKLTGSATAIRNGVSIQLNVGDNVNKSDVVQAGSDSSLGLTFIDGTVFGLSSNARMVLNEMVYDPNGSSNSSLLSLVQGTITFVAGETARHGDMKVDTPVATMGIRGTAVLVEIDFTVPGQGGAPPVKFSVLVEPGGHVGSYFLYSKTDPNQIIGQVDQAGQVTSVDGAGDTTTTPAPPLTPIALAIIQQTFQEYFPNYVPGTNPRGTSPLGGSTPQNPVPGSTNPDPLKFEIPDFQFGVPTIVPISLPFFAPNTPPIDVIITRFNTAPTIIVTPVVVTLPANKTGFDIADQVKITDPDSADVATPYVAGTAHIISATGPSNTPATIDLETLITIDPVTGQVTYNPAAFAFLGAGQTAVYVIGFDSKSGPYTVHETLTFTVDGVNDAPSIASAQVVVAEGGTVVLKASDIVVVDPDSTNFTFTVSNVTHGRFQTTTDGVHWYNASTFTTADLNSGHVRFMQDGSGDAPTFAIQADDGASLNHLSTTIAGTVVFTPVNVAPTISSATLVVSTGGTVILDASSLTVTHVYTLVDFSIYDPPGLGLVVTTDNFSGVQPHLSIAVNDPDSNSFTFTVSNVTHGSFQTTSDGIHWIDATTFTTADIDASHVRFVQDGSAGTPTFSIQADDGASINHASNIIAGNVSVLTVIVVGPSVNAPLTVAAHEGDAAFTANLLAGATDNSGSLPLSVTDVQYSVDGSTASQTAPAGVTLNGATLSVDPTNPAFAHLAQGQTETIIVTYYVTDVHGATVAQTETVTITGINDAPTVSAPLTSAAHKGDPAFTANLLAGATDPDNGETATLTVTDVNYSVDGGTASQTAPTGVTLNGATLSVDPTNPAFAQLFAGQSETIVVTYDITDVHGATVTQSETITINGTGSAPIYPVTAVWTGGGDDGDWNNPANWNPHVPTDIDTASFTTSAAVAISSDIVIAGLILAEGAAINVSTDGTPHVIDVTGSLSNDGEIVLHAGTTLEVTGTVDNAGTITVDDNHLLGATLLIDGNVTLEGGGVVTLDGTADHIAEQAPGATLENVDNKIDGYGTIGDGHLTLVNDAGGIIAATDLLHGLTINTGDGTFTNYGLIVSASLFGGLEITGNIINDGTLEAHTGILKIDGNVTGHGDAVIDGGVLEFGAASDAAVQFTGNTSDLLLLDRGSHFTGTVTGFSFGDTIDLACISSRNIHLHTNANGTTTVDYGTGSFTIDGDYARSGFIVTSDLHGGTAIIWTDPAPQISTSDVELSQHGGTTTIYGLSVSDFDAGRNETFTLSTDTVSGCVDVTSDSGRLSDINRDLQHGVSYHSDDGSTGMVSVTVADHLGATDTVNFIFSTNPSPSTPVTLTGTAGKDVIFATTQTDILTGGGSADQFVFATPSGNHTITDFTPGQDKIELDFAPSGPQAFQQWLASAAVPQGPDTLIHLDNAGDTLLLKHIAVTDLHTSDFIVHANQAAA